MPETGVCPGRAFMSTSGALLKPGCRDSKTCLPFRSRGRYSQDRTLDGGQPRTRHREPELSPRWTEEILLAAFPGIAAINRPDHDQWGDDWRFTATGVRLLFGEAFPPVSLSVTAAENVLAAAAFLCGLAVEQLRTGELEHVTRITSW